VAPARIEPSVQRPADFDSFWEAKIKALNEIPVNPELTPRDSGRPGAEFFTFKLDSLGSKVQGYLARPAKQGKFPAIVLLQWRACTPCSPTSRSTARARGWLALNVDSMTSRRTSGGPPSNYAGIGNMDRETSYFLKMYCGTIARSTTLRACRSGRQDPGGHGYEHGAASRACAWRASIQR